MNHFLLQSPIGCSAIPRRTLLYLSLIMIVVLSFFTGGSAIKSGNLVSLPQGDISVRWRGACRCYSRNFKNAVQAAFVTVHVSVISRGEIYRLSRTDRRLLIFRYRLKVIQNFGYRGPSNGRSFYAEAFDNVDFCGVRLITGRTYLLNLANPSRRSMGSHWPRGIYVMDACDMHYAWSSLQLGQQQFLWSRIRG